MARGTTTRERLVQTAAELFWSQGYARTGVSAIIKRARATSGSFYHFFPTKEDLLVAVLDLVAGRLESEILDPAAAAARDPMTRIELVIESYAAAVESGGRTVGLPLGTLVGELGSNHDTARRKIDGLFDRLVTRIAGWLVGDDGEPERRGDDREVAEVVVAALEGAAVMALTRRSRAPIDAAGRWLRRHPALAARGGLEGRDEMHLPAAAAHASASWKAW